jgi:DNA-binding GntR family transcriptional regulator
MNIAQTLIEFLEPIVEQLANQYSFRTADFSDWVTRDNEQKKTLQAILSELRKGDPWEHNAELQKQLDAALERVVELENQPHK